MGLRRTARPLGLLLCLLLVGGACVKPTSTRSAEAFIEQYYVQVNLQKAKELTSGLATEKINQEIALGGGEASAAAKSGRQVTFTAQGPSRDSDLQGQKRSEVFYDLKINVGSEESLQKTVRITLEDHDQQWKVVNFAETSR